MGDKDAEFPQVQGGGSLILAWQIKGKKVLIVGGGEVAAGRILNCLNADALVTVVCPAAGLNPEVAHRIAQGQVTHIDRCFVPSDLDGDDSSSNNNDNDNNNNISKTNQTAPALVMTAIDDPAASTEIWRLCRQRRLPANIADVPPECDFYFGSVHRDGPLQIMVSTNGKGPRLAAQIRQRIAAGLPRNAGAAVEKVGRLRGMLRRVEPGSGDAIPRRMGWMIRVSDCYSWETFCGLDDEDMENLLRFYPDEVPDLETLKSLREVPEYWEFDGSFGFSVGC